MNLRNACLTGLVSAVVLSLASCSDDDNWGVVDGAKPDFDPSTEHIMTAAGRTAKIKGLIKDADGIASIRLSCPELMLNKTIDLIEIYGEPKTEYELDYDYKIQESVTGDSFNVVVTVTDVAGQTEEKTILVTLDGDFVAPSFSAAPDKEMTVLLKANTVFNLNFTVDDNMGIDYVTVNVEGVDGFPVRIEGNGNKTVTYTNKLSLPSEAQTYNLVVEAFDLPAQEGEVRSSKVESTLSVSELPDFNVIYLCDVETAAELNSDVFGVPMAMDHFAPYSYRVRYYNEKAGTKICFLPQRTDFGPICFGPEDGDLLGDDPETVGRITLDKAGVYYLIEVNTFDRTYTMSTYSPSEAVNPVMHLHYGGNDLNTWWEVNNFDDIWWQEWFFGPGGNPDQIKLHMDQDRNNPHLYTMEWKLTEGTERFQIANWHSHGWWNFTAWRVDDADDASKCMYYGNVHPTIPGHYESNEDYFQWKYMSLPASEYKFMYPAGGESFDIGSWGSEGYRKNFVPDNWINAHVPADGTYRLIFDLHSEHVKLVPVK